MCWNIATVFVFLAGVAFVAYLCATYVIRLKCGDMFPIVCLLVTIIFQTASIVAMYMRHEPFGNILPALFMLAVMASIILNDIAKRRTSA
jgi:hypothetical protein